MDPTACGIILWTYGIAAAIYAAKALRWFGLTRLARVPALSPRPPLQLEAFLVGLAGLMLVMEPVYIASGGTADGVLAAWRERLPYVAVATSVAGFLSGMFGAASPLRIGIRWHLTAV